MASTLTPEVVADGFMFPEGPRWWDGRLWFSDVYGCKVHRMDADGANLETVAEVAEWPSGLGELPDGTRIVVEMRSQKVHCMEADGSLSPFADLAHLAVNELNDLVTGEHGRSYVGCYGFDIRAGATPAPGYLILIEPDATARRVADDVMFPNGLVIADEGSTLVAAQTLGGEVTAFDIADDGSLTNRRVWASLPDRHPDGMCLDAEGALWVASSFTSEFLRVLPGGEITHRIETPGRWALAPMLGGDDRRTLYLLSTETDLERLRRMDMRGRVEAVRVDTPGAGLP